MPNLKNTIEALPVLLGAPKNVAVFEKYGVLSEREVHSRYDIYVERYCKDVNTESLTALTIAKTMILPAAYRYQGELAATAASLKATPRAQRPHGDRSKRSPKLVSRTGKDHCARWKPRPSATHVANGDLLAEAKHFEGKVIPAMKAVRDGGRQARRHRGRRPLAPADLSRDAVHQVTWSLPTICLLSLNRNIGPAGRRGKRA